LLVGRTGKIIDVNSVLTSLHRLFAKIESMSEIAILRHESLGRELTQGAESLLSPAVHQEAGQEEHHRAAIPSRTTL
jgi:hypothetical protein